MPKIQFYLIEKVETCTIIMTGSIFSEQNIIIVFKIKNRIIEYNWQGENCSIESGTEHFLFLQR